MEILLVIKALRFASDIGLASFILEGCKVEFNQPSCWLYFVLHLLVFQQLIILYFGGILVRVVSEIV